MTGDQSTAGSLSVRTSLEVFFFASTVSVIYFFGPCPLTYSDHEYGLWAGHIGRHEVKQRKARHGMACGQAFDPDFALLLYLSSMLEKRRVKRNKTAE
jgi:hypothetical protein